MEAIRAQHIYFLSEKVHSVNNLEYDFLIWRFLDDVVYVIQVKLRTALVISRRLILSGCVQLLVVAIQLLFGSLADIFVDKVQHATTLKEFQLDELFCVDLRYNTKRLNYFLAALSALKLVLALKDHLDCLFDRNSALLYEGFGFGGFEYGIKLLQLFLIFYHQIRLDYALLRVVQDLPVAVLQILQVPRSISARHDQLVLDLREHLGQLHFVDVDVAFHFGGDV